MQCSALMRSFAFQWSCEVSQVVQGPAPWQDLSAAPFHVQPHQDRSRIYQIPSTWGMHLRFWVWWTQMQAFLFFFMLLLVSGKIVLAVSLTEISAMSSKESNFYIKFLEKNPQQNRSDLVCVWLQTPLRRSILKLWSQHFHHKHT